MRGEQPWNIWIGSYREDLQVYCRHCGKSWKDESAWMDDTGSNMAHGWCCSMVVHVDDDYDLVMVPAGLLILIGEEEEI